MAKRRGLAKGVGIRRGDGYQIGNVEGGRVDPVFADKRLSDIFITAFTALMPVSADVLRLCAGSD